MSPRAATVLACAWLLALCAGGENAAVPPPIEHPEDRTVDAQAAAEDEQTDEANAAEPAEAAEPEAAVVSEEVFTPSENISEDIAVPLPVDI